MPVQPNYMPHTCFTYRRRATEPSVTVPCRSGTPSKSTTGALSTTHLSLLRTEITDISMCMYVHTSPRYLSPDRTTGTRTFLFYNLLVPVLIYPIFPISVHVPVWPHLFFTRARRDTYFRVSLIDGTFSVIQSLICFTTGQLQSVGDSSWWVTVTRVVTFLECPSLLPWRFRGDLPETDGRDLGGGHRLQESDTVSTYRLGSHRGKDLF